MALTFQFPSADDDGDPFLEFGWIPGFLDIVSNPRLQAPALLFDVYPGGRDNHRDMLGLWIAFQLVQHLEPIHDGHVQIHRSAVLRAIRWRVLRLRSSHDINSLTR